VALPFLVPLWPTSGACGSVLCMGAGAHGLPCALRPFFGVVLGVWVADLLCVAELCELGLGECELAMMRALMALWVCELLTCCVWRSCASLDWVSVSLL